MFDLLKFLSKEDASKNVAKERLKLVLVHDRSNCSPEFLELVKGDLLKAISSYMDIDERGLDIKITRTDDTKDGRPALVANIPIRGMKRG
ncbi:MAG: cell division topological specificity factor MinE [Acidaminobacteraceae bacterium]